MTDPDGARAHARSGLPTRPRSRSGWARRSRRSGRTGQKIQRPKITRSAGSSVTMTSRVTRDADGEDRPRLAVELRSAKSQAQQADHDGRGAGEDRGRRPVQRERHRLVPVLVAAQLLAISGHQQQRVVGAGADHQDAQDVLALVVDRRGRRTSRAGRPRRRPWCWRRRRRRSAASRGPGCGR